MAAFDYPACVPDVEYRETPGHVGQSDWGDQATIDCNVDAKYRDGNNCKCNTHVLNALFSLAITDDQICDGKPSEDDHRNSDNLIHDQAC